MPEIFTGKPSWLIILCLALAAMYVAALYFRERKNEFHPALKVLMGFLRFIAVFLIAFMLLSPFIRSISKEKEKPLILVALDDSQSITLNSDSSWYQNEFLQQADKMCDELARTGDVRRFTFGDRIKAIDNEEGFAGNVDFSQPITDISGLVTELRSRYTNMNVGALIIATDGIYNTGSSPVYQADKWTGPVYTLALGDTSVRTDVIIDRVNYNRMVYLNNKFPLEIVVKARAAGGKEARISVSHKGSILYNQTFSIDNDDFTLTVPVILDARETGIQKYSIAIEAVDGELSLLNNRKDIYVEVLDAKSRVLIVGSAPHPDISALKQAISSNLNYEVSEILLNDLNENLEQYRLVILHQLPSLREPAERIISSLSEKKIPALFILGTQSDLARFNQMANGLNIRYGGKPAFEEAVPVYNSAFSAFSLSDETRAWFSGLPPLNVSLGDYQVPNSARIILTQRIGSVETSRPLILFNESLDGRSGLIAGEGLWKWRLYNYAKSSNHQAFNELINKIIQYLSLKEQKKNFRVYNQVNFRENEPVIFDAEVYDENYELTIEPEAELSIQSEEGAVFPFSFNRLSNAYRLDAGSFPPGNYSYMARATLGNTVFTHNGQFSISSLDLEALNTIADHRLLYQLAEESGGALYYPGDLDKLTEDILAREDIRPVSYSIKKYKDLLNNGWLLVSILSLLALEWFLRKRAGAY